MKTPLTCPQCNCRMSVSDKALRQKILCPQCGMYFVAGEAAQPATVYEARVAPRSSIVPALCWILVAGLFLSALVFAVAASNSSNRAREIRAQRFNITGAPSAEAEDAGQQAPWTTLWWVGLLFCAGTLAVVYVVAVVLIVVWVARDARNRGMKEHAVWITAVALTGPMGLLVYLAARPPGILVGCEHCQNRRLHYAQLCPHCGQHAG